MRGNSLGKCEKCGQALTKKKMEKHVLECFSAEGGKPMLCLRVDGGGQYWLYAAVEEFAPLEALDKLLRDTWLECCGHLSCFRCASGTYQSAPEPGEKGMRKVSVLQAFPEGKKAEYEYDFGSTTKLSIVRVGELKAGDGKKAMILARNNMLEEMCDVCKKGKATQVSALDGKLVCEECAGNLGKDEQYLLPYVNSPRTGVCGYTGKAW